MIYSDEELIADIKLVASKYGKNKVSIGEYNMIGKFAPNTIAKRFGSWTAAMTKAGLEYNTKEKRGKSTMDRRKHRSREVSQTLRLSMN